MRPLLWAPTTELEMEVASVTGQTVVVKSMTSVMVTGPVELPALAGQFVIVGAHEVMVCTLVMATVKVVEG
jgi:hypothetical protein